jgi:hypothetical protein
VPLANLVRLIYSVFITEKNVVRVDSLFGAANSRKRNVCGFLLKTATGAQYDNSYPCTKLPSQSISE